MISLAFIMAFIGAAIAMLIGIMIFSEIDNTIDCGSVSETMYKECENAKSTAWTVIGILPIALFFAIFAISGGLFEGGISNPLSKLKNIRVKNPKGGWKAKWVEPKRSINILEKIMLWFGLAKATRRE
jgi:hypothetical protein